MGKVNKVVVFGKTKTGKTAIINKIIYPDSNMVGVVSTTHKKLTSIFDFNPYILCTKVAFAFNFVFS